VRIAALLFLSGEIGIGIPPNHFMGAVTKGTFGG